MTTQTTQAPTDWTDWKPPRYPSSILDLATWDVRNAGASGSGVYAAMNSRDEVIDKSRPEYIGSTMDCTRRFRNHHAFWLPSRWVLWLPFPGMLLMRCLEYALIEKYHPINNLHGRGKAAQKLAQWFLGEIIDWDDIDGSRPLAVNPGGEL